MALPAEVMQEIFTVIEGGAQVGTPADIIQFPVDSGAKSWNVVQKTYTGTNGTGFNYWVVAFEALIGEVAYALSAGAAMLTFEVGVFGAAVAPALGIGGGYLLYNLSPEFWNSVSAKLVEAGETIGGKVVGLINVNGNLTFSPTAINIFKNALIEAGVFVNGATWDGEQPEGFHLVSPIVSSTRQFEASTSGPEMHKYQYVGSRYYGDDDCYCGLALGNMTNTDFKATSGYDSEGNFYAIMCSKEIFTATQMHAFTYSSNTYRAVAWGSSVEHFIHDSKHVFYTVFNLGGTGTQVTDSIGTNISNFISELYGPLAWVMQYGEFIDNPYQEGWLQPSRHPREDEDVQETYGDTWPIWDFPIEDPYHEPIIDPELPVEYPDYDDETSQEEAQDPDDNTEDAYDYMSDDDNHPGDEIEQDEDEIDPDPGTPEPDPVPDEDTGSDTPDPPDPDPGTIIPTPIPIPSDPDTVESSKLFTVYNPTQSEINSLGAYLWDDDLIDVLKRIWQNPLDGIISLIQVYCTPSTGGSQHIVLGYLDSGVSAKVVTSQFVTINCGTIQVKEDKKNATDYSPYSALHLYLPFIGITEINVNEFMAGSISVVYHIDVYTGSCLAEVKVTRERDIPNSGILYTFNGNCSQQIPLTSGDAKGVLQALIGAAGVGLGIASGNASVAGMIAGELANDVSREMLHVSHSGNLSANAGIMGQKKPYIILTRQKPYTANGYNKMWGFPINKTVYLGNCSGYVRVRAGRLRSKATQDEKNEIYELLRNGVIM